MFYETYDRARKKIDFINTRFEDLKISNFSCACKTNDLKIFVKQ